MTEAARGKGWWLGLRARHTRAAPSVRVSDVRQAYELLRVVFVALPLAMAIDKIAELELLARWSEYLAPRLIAHSPLGVREILRLCGMLEAVVAALVLLRPRVGALVEAAWLVVIIVDLALLGGHGDLVLVDGALVMAALALSRLAAHFESTSAADVLQEEAE